jgi:serine/threonine protein kinase
MRPELHREAGDLFARLRERPKEEWTAAVAAASAGKPELGEYVLQLLEAARGADTESFLARPAAADLEWTTPRPSLPPGTVLGNYRLGSRIGVGGMGQVFRGEDLRLERPVAIKILTFPGGGAEQQAEAVQRFAREARAASRLNHPNIVSIYDADFDARYHCIATEFIEGRTLRQIITANPAGLAETEILDIVGQTASALGAAHEAGIVHRDIKPENIMVRPDGFVKVLDFGLATMLDSSGSLEGESGLRTRPGHIAGTVHYLSPEQVLGKAVDARSDLFSLGVVAYELATGKRPFEGGSVGEIFDAILHQTPAPASSLHPALSSKFDSLIQRLLEKVPENRIQAASELRRSGVSGLVIDAPRRKRPTWPIATASLGVLALVSGVIWLTSPPAPLKVGEIVQVTSDGLPKSRFVTDGTRLFYSSGKDDVRNRMFQAGLNGGDPVEIPQLAGMFPLDVSPDRSRLLLGQFVASVPQGPYPIWSADSLGNGLRRLGDAAGYEARWSPDGSQIVFGNGAELRIARADGSASRAVRTFPGIVHDPVWSPDGREIRFILMSGKNTELWEMRADGSGEAHPLLPAWRGYSERHGVWTPDGKAFVFAAGTGRVRDLWSLPHSALPMWGGAAPQRLTAGPMRAFHPEIGPEGRRTYFLANFDRGELVRYDAHAGMWVPQLGGLSATQLDYSRDGKWVVWVSCPEGVVWRSAADGSQRLQLTSAPLGAINPRWSPDGLSIAFYGAEPGKPSRLYVVPSSGGAVREVSHGEAGSAGDADGSWSPDSQSLVFAVNSDDQVRKQLPLRVLDLRSGKVSALPGSEGLWSPRWSADGRSIVALSTPVHEVWLYDVRTHGRRRLTEMAAGFPCWSADWRFVYFEDASMTTWHRVAVDGGVVETLASLRSLTMAGPSLGWAGVAPDGSLMVTRAVGGTEIYRFDWAPIP